VSLIHEALKIADGHPHVERILLMILVTARNMIETRAPAAYQMALQALDRGSNSWTPAAYREDDIAHQCVVVVSSQEEFEVQYNTHPTAEETVIWDIADKQVRNNRCKQAAQWCESSSALRNNGCDKGDPNDEYRRAGYTSCFRQVWQQEFLAVPPVSMVFRQGECD
jgi:hypothetical protein